MQADYSFVDSILHPTDLSPASKAAFFHALAAAVRHQTKLTVLHARAMKPNRKTWSGFPEVRDTLERWGLLDEGSPRTAVESELGVRIDKVTVRSFNATKAIRHYIGHHRIDLIVAATAGRTGLARWIRPSVAARAARTSRTMTLFVPNEARGFISPTDGTSTLRRILVPVDYKPRSDRAVRMASLVAHSFGASAGDVAIDLLHVGSGFPDFYAPDDDNWNWEAMTRRGWPVKKILETAKERQTDLIVMATAGRAGPLDALRGSTTERVVRRAPCPILAVPAR